MSSHLLLLSVPNMVIRHVPSISFSLTSAFLLGPTAATPIHIDTVSSVPSNASSPSSSFPTTPQDPFQGHLREKEVPATHWGLEDSTEGAGVNTFLSVYTTLGDGKYLYFTLHCHFINPYDKLILGKIPYHRTRIHFSLFLPPHLPSLQATLLLMPLLMVGIFLIYEYYFANTLM